MKISLISSKITLRVIPALMILGSLLLTGCLRPRMMITSEPSGAEVIWRGKPYGATPITIPFNWYWYYDYSIEKPGYESIEVAERLHSPPWFLIPLDLVMEIIPIPITDTRERHYVLEPSPITEPSSEPQREVIITPEMLKAIEEQASKVQP